MSKKKKIMLSMGRRPSAGMVRAVRLKQTDYEQVQTQLTQGWNHLAAEEENAADNLIEKLQAVNAAEQAMQLRMEERMQQNGTLSDAALARHKGTGLIEDLRDDEKEVLRSSHRPDPTAAELKLAFVLQLCVYTLTALFFGIGTSCFDPHRDKGDIAAHSAVCSWAGISDSAEYETHSYRHLALWVILPMSIAVVSLLFLHSMWAKLLSLLQFSSSCTATWGVTCFASGNMCMTKTVFLNTKILLLPCIAICVFSVLVNWVNMRDWKSVTSKAKERFCKAGVQWVVLVYR
jgi:hypothetical protein